MKWLKSLIALIAIVSATAITGSAFADVRVTFGTGGLWYAPPAARYYYYEPSPYDYGPVRRYQYYGRDANYYYYYGEPVYNYSYYNRQFPQSSD